jgi:anti-sigma regulatory factor (Ser/Thr protein kinase)
MVEITIVNRRAEFARVTSLVDQLGVEHRLPRGVIADVCIALDEILTNITDYAYSDDAEHEIHIRFEALDNVLEAVIEDGGAPFNPLAIPAPDVSAPLHERRVGGVGIHFVRNLMDEVTYERAGERNRLVLRKRFET